MDSLIIYEFIYLVVLILVCLRIIFDTQNTAKTLAYILFAIFVPVVGMIFYFLFGINYRNRKMYKKKLFEDEDLSLRLREKLYTYSKQTFAENKAELEQYKDLAYLLLNDTKSPLTAHNQVKVLINGENKFPEVLEALKNARHHIHFEYYIYEDGEIGRQIEEILIEKAKQGVTVRFIYDDFGSLSIRRSLAKRLKANGVNAFPFLKIYFIAFANRLNYRNHRKIIIVDGKTAFVGGINVSDRYINDPNNPQQVYWRDTHIRINGLGVHYLQYLFLSDWNFCAGENLQPNEAFFPTVNTIGQPGNKVVQIAASGPDSDTPTILYAVLQFINLAKSEILVTSPYFIPYESLFNALIIASLSGIKVKLLVPGISDSVLVNAAARSYYSDLMKAGVEIYLYKKGFMHAKTVVTDEKIAMVGTANMDIRSFDLNFEVNAIVYDSEIAQELKRSFIDDLTYAEKIDSVSWGNRPLLTQLFEKTARLVSPLL